MPECYNTAVASLCSHAFAISTERQAGVTGCSLALLVVHLALRWTAPSSSFALVVQIALTFAGLLVGVRWARRGIRAAVWRLRYRLVVVYLFIAVVPIVLILLLAGIGSYTLTGQITVRLVTSAIDRRAGDLLEHAQALLDAAPQDRPQMLRWLAPHFHQQYPGLELLVHDRREWRVPPEFNAAAPGAAHGTTTGLVLREGRPYLWAHAVRGSAEAVLAVPLTREVMAGLAPSLGEVILDHRGAWRRSAGVRGGRVPAPASRFDIPVTWGSTVPVAVWDRPGIRQQSALGVSSRPSAVLRALFSEEIGLGSI